MKAVHFRPKYDIEQYAINFQFPDESLDEDLLLSVEAVSGESPAGLSLGPVFRAQNNVFIVVTGGTVGEVYKISCTLGEVTYEGCIAVKKASVTVPAGTGDAPFIKEATTPPYSIYNADILNISTLAQSGRHIQEPLDLISLTVRALNGEHRAQVVTYENYPPDGISLLVSALDGTHSLVIQEYKNYPPDAIGLSVTARNGSHKLERIEYLNYAPEALSLSVKALNGQHSVA